MSLCCSVLKMRIVHNSCLGKRQSRLQNSKFFFPPEGKFSPCRGRIFFMFVFTIAKIRYVCQTCNSLQGVVGRFAVSSELSHLMCHYVIMSLLKSEKMGKIGL